jgi:GDSL-like Lipase/Acylhydrolase family
MKLFVFRCIFGLFVAVPVLAIFEIGLRLLFPGAFLAPQPGFMVEGPEYPSHLLPGFRGSERNFLVYDPGAPLTEWTITINLAGWREPAYPKARPANTKRLMVLGDSVTFGMGVDDTCTLPAFLKRDVDLDLHASWQVFNRSVPGWHSWHQARHLRLQGPEMRPDIVTVHVVMNDFGPRTDAYYEGNAAGNLVPGRKGILDRVRIFNLVRQFFAEPSRFQPHRGNELLSSPKVEIPEADLGVFGQDKWWYLRYLERDKAHMDARRLSNDIAFARYREMRDVAGRIGAKLLIVLHPTASQMGPRYWGRNLFKTTKPERRPLTALVARFRAEGFEVLDLTPALEAMDEPVFLDEAHHSALGNAVAAHAVTRKLLDLGWLELGARPFAGLGSRC